MNYMKRQTKAKTLNSVERISKIKSEIAAMECNRSVAAAILQKGAAQIRDCQRRPTGTPFWLHHNLHLVLEQMADFLPIA